jgi:CCR4-NOT transcription complex subunit 1
MLIHLFTEIKDDSFKEVTMKVLLERVLCHRPHPWGIVMTIIELIRDPKCDLMNSKFMRSFPEISAILRKINSHVNGNAARPSLQ